ncbi:hypothetical protein PCC7418_3180 [Halothece sp. PCC 7418]|uniref:GIY-YIG nuclease family protein n=1 Tax=Halothece sp. (strain PCC 7418) TaxID=65093 RepID=UPI0002A088A3|nr:GIY-YIG nuclease family protein [Halothece sp. PCC 7418]AFZ45299.1 hypothetical protein PCC7418_3180 [Halothece sp. PCC 7418]
MSSGYVYILTNVSLPGLIKVGRTIRDSRSRARELFTTGVPTPFQVAFEIFSDEHEELEADFHKELHDFRISDNREFFNYPLNQAIILLQKLNNSQLSKEFIAQAEDIFEPLKKRYLHYLRPEIIGVRIVQIKKRVWLEITEEEKIAGYLINTKIIRTDLAFITDDYDFTKNENNCQLFFDPKNDVRENARKFIEDFDPYSIMMTTDLFRGFSDKNIN